MPPVSISTSNIREMLDIMILAAPYDFESIANLDSVKDFVVNATTQQVVDIYKDPELSEEERILSVISAMSYLVLENFLHHSQKQGEK